MINRAENHAVNNQPLPNLCDSDLIASGIPMTQISKATGIKIAADWKKNGIPGKYQPLLQTVIEAESREPEITIDPFLSLSKNKGCCENAALSSWATDTTSLMQNQAKIAPQSLPQHEKVNGIIKDDEGLSVMHTKFDAPLNWEDALTAHVDEFNKTHAQVLIGGNHRIMRTVPANARTDNRESYEFLSQEALVKIYQNLTIKTDEKISSSVVKEITTNHILAWAKHPNCRIYRGGVIFKPAGSVPAGYFNTWREFAVGPKENSDLWALIKKHIEDVVCGCNKELIEYFYNWVAYTLQYPDKPAGAALVIRGEKGTGKGTLGHFLRYLWGNHALHISNAKHLVGSFNGHLNDVCFLFADEAFYSGDKQHEGVLKALITEPSIVIERKGIDATSQPNYLKVFMVTNSDFAVPASKDERRYCVFDVLSVMKGDKAYFDSLHHACIDKDVQAAFLYDMLNRDISQFHTGQIPESIGLKEQRYHSLPSAGKWFADSLINGTFDVAGYNCEKWQKEVLSSDLHASYLRWCDRQKTGEYSRDTQIILSKYLGEIYIKKLIGNGRLSGFVLGTVEEAIYLFEQAEKVKLPVEK